MRVRPEGQLRPILSAVVFVVFFFFLQEVWNLSSQWDQTDSSWPTYQKLQEQARAEMAAWEAWSEGEDQQIPQVLAVINTAENSGDPLCPGSEGGRSQDGGSRTGTRPQGRAFPAPSCEGEVVSRK